MSGFVGRFSHRLHQHFIWVLLGSYAAAAFAPRVGLWIKGFSVNEFVLFGARFHVPLTLADHPRAMLPIIVYTLVQNIIAGCVDRLMFRRIGAT